MRPPSFTCPTIDAAQHRLRAIAWRVRRGERLDEVAALTREALALMEEVREMNRQLREWGRARNGTEPYPLEHPETAPRAPVERETGSGVGSETGEEGEGGCGGFCAPADSSSRMTTRWRTG